MHVVIASRPAGFVVDLTMALQRQGARVTLVDDGAALLDALAEPVDLVVGSVDLAGPTAAHALAMARTAGVRVPFILVLPRRMTGMREDVAHTARAAGLAGVVDEDGAIAASLGALRTPADATPHDPHPARRAGGDARVLVAEDDREMRRLIVDELESRGYTVEQAEDGRELILRLDDLKGDADAPFDLIVSDVRMPGATGIEALALLRRARWSLPVILMTSFGDDAVHAEGHRLGALAVFDKPLDVDELMDLVAGAVGRPLS